jgi:threonine synthase
VYEKYRTESGDDKITVVISTASPYKFPRSVVTAIDGGAAGDDFAIGERLHDIIGGPVPPAIAEARTAPVCHQNHCAVADMVQVVKGYLGV